MLSIAFVSAIGWGVTGMISYGRVLGYGRSDNLTGRFHLNHHLYVVNFIIIFFLLKKTGYPLVGIHIHKMNYGRYRLWLAGIIAAIAILALIAISIHGVINGVHNRFPL